MDNRSDNIIGLAHEILRSNKLIEDMPEPKSTVTLKILCITSLLAAFGGSALTAWANETLRPLNHYEKTELEALIFYAARTKGTTEDTLRHEVVENVGVSSLDDMTEHDFHIARRYLQNRAM